MVSCLAPRHAPFELPAAFDQSSSAIVNLRSAIATSYEGWRVAGREGLYGGLVDDVARLICLRRGSTQPARRQAKDHDFLPSLFPQQGDSCPFGLLIGSMPTSRRRSPRKPLPNLRQL